MEVHGEPERPDEEACDAGYHILRNFGAFLTAQCYDLLVVGLHLGIDRRAIHVRILCLNDRHRSRSAPGACGHDKCRPEDNVQVQFH